ncbi:hypothetical protein PO909_016024 [Leuciscus waleckii]
MEKMALFSVLIILACLHVHSVRSAIGSTEINCVRGSNIVVGSISEGYEGDVEIITNIGPYDRLYLEPHMSYNVLTMLELVYSAGDSNATVRTIRPLDAEEIKKDYTYLTYHVTCFNGPKNSRIVNVMDVNDNPPIFQSKTYNTTLLKSTIQGSEVLKVTAIDKDITEGNNRVSYSILPPVPADFTIVGNGGIILIKHLNYNSTQYIFTVLARDAGGLNDTATVTITIEHFAFDVCLYNALIGEKQVGRLDITPEDLHAHLHDGHTSSSKPVVYSITSVIPSEFQNNFKMENPKYGTISVTTALGREGIEKIVVFIQATLQDDASKTANAVVLVTIV